MPSILIAPDKFKGSLAASAVAAALRDGLLAVSPDLEVRCLPVADGGEGTLDAALAAGFDRVELLATGPVGDPIATAYARRGNTAVVEMADISGLSRLPAGRSAALTATSRGTGDVIGAAVQAGCTHIVVGIGGSACTDGGAGMVQALGAKLADGSGAELAGGGASLADLAEVDISALAWLAAVTITIACDVDNPLTGPQGAAAVYGPQKGASPEEVAVLDAALDRWGDLVARATGRDVRDTPGAGAAGGVGFAGLALLGAELRPGIDLMLELLDFPAHLDGADLVVVGEGSLDAQSLHGKAPVGVARAARGVRVIAVCGRKMIDDEALARVGIATTYALSDLEPDPAASMAGAAGLLERVGRQIAVEQFS